MKLLFDENVSPRLVEILADVYPDSAHVRGVRLLGAADVKIWGYAREHGLTIVSKDTDFRDRSVIEGFPPKIVWLAVGNAGTKAIAALLQREHERMETFDEQNETSVLILSIATTVN